MKLRLVLAAAGGLALSVAVGAHAEQVGRVRFNLPSGEWVHVATRDHEMRFDSGMSSIPMQTAVYALPGDGASQRALLVVTATAGGQSRRVRWSSEPCPDARPRFYSNDFGTGHAPNQRECVVVNPAFNSGAYFGKDRWAWLHEALEVQGARLLRGGISLRATSTNDRGTLLAVNLVAARGFQGLNAPLRDVGDLHDVPPPFVAWGEALHDAVRASVYSTSGALELPPVEFEPVKKP
jgi:hypothetical protein